VGLLTEWIINIIIFLLLAMVIDMLLPESDMKKYVKLVTGLLLIAIIITPIFKIMSTDFDQVLASLSENEVNHDQTQESLLELKKKEIQASNHAYTLEQMAVQMKDEVEKELMDNFGMSITNISISAGTDLEPTTETLQKITVYLEPGEEKIALVKPVRINVKNEADRTNTIDHAGIILTLSKHWEVPESIIELVAEGRN
jgi:stage III sporulation protein AF